MRNFAFQKTFIFQKQSIFYHLVLSTVKMEFIDDQAAVDNN